MVDVMVPCPCCAGDGCVVCYDAGVVKRSNLDRAGEDSVWSEDALRRLVSPLPAWRRTSSAVLLWVLVAGFTVAAGAIEQVRKVRGHEPTVHG